jgi:fatty-acid desaturase
LNLHQKVKSILLLTNIIGLVGLIFFFSWWGLAVAVSTWIIFNYGVSAGFHRLFCHRSFETNKFIKQFLLIAGTFASIGSSISWIGQHRLHHAYSDVEEKDPYYPHNGWIKAWIFGPWPIATSPMVVKDLLRDPTHKFLHHNYFKILFAYILILSIINPLLVIWAWALPAAGTFFSLQVTGVLGHMIGRIDYPETHDQSRNSDILNLLTFGESYQNTHHRNATQVVMGKYDIIGYTIKYLFAKK